MTDTAKRSYQDIVIGGGHNGLVCAALLARAGRSVLVLEAASELGGAARNREFAPGFTVPAGAHLLHGLADEVVRDLGLQAHGLRFAATALPTRALAVEGKALRLDEIRAAGEGLSAADIAAYAPFMATMRRHAAALLPIFRMTPPRLVFDTWAQKGGFLKLAWRLRRMGRRDLRELLRIIGMNAYDLLDEYFESDRLKGALAFDAVLGAEWGPRAPGSVLTWLHRLTGIAGNGGRGIAQPLGGMGAVVRALAAAATTAGAALRTGARVRRILVEDDRACGVELASGETLRAEHVISNADPRTTFLDLLGAAHLDTGFVRKTQHLRTSGRAGKLHLALAGLPAFNGCDANALGDRLLIAPSMNHIERAFNPSKYREYPSDPVLEISIPTVRDPSLAPSGRHVLSAIVQFLPCDDGPDRDASRARCLETILATLERHAPGIRESIVAAELRTPHDLEQEFGMRGGHWHHNALGLENFFFLRPLPGAAQYSTPVAGLYLCGAGCHPGGGVMGVAGRNAAMQVLGGGR